ncbi:MAG: PLP-dependent transferase [Acidobacteria bacterium]|nr:MAG: PLP-dependent transferase [Acidobacteriota bacterium]REJ99621.1 MAG: PLP-dependent transferase [Acidobacteriota bacterium]
MKGNPSGRGFATRAIHAGQAPDPRTGAVAVPIYQTSTYVQPEAGVTVEYDYARVRNPTRDALEQCVASLESGAAGHAFSSGMAAISALLTTMRSDEHIVVSRNVYGGTFRLLEQVLDRYRLRASWVDTTDLDAVRDAIEDGTRWVLLETPTNPMMEISDVAAVSELAHERGVHVAVDNTFLSPYLQRPIELGADVVVHSTTKFMGGHSDSIGGVLITRLEEHASWFRFIQKSVGAVLAPFECFLVMRGLKTLAVRMDRHEQNTARIVEFLTRHPAVRKLYYPGLPDAPGHSVQKKQASGFGALLSLELGSFAAAKKLLDRVEVMSLAESLGGVETLISHPASMTHAAVPAERRAALGITEGLVRISVGIETIDDLLGDLEQGLS